MLICSVPTGYLFSLLPSSCSTLSFCLLVWTRHLLQKVLWCPVEWAYRNPNGERKQLRTTVKDFELYVLKQSWRNNTSPCQLISSHYQLPLSYYGTLCFIQEEKKVRKGSSLLKLLRKIILIWARFCLAFFYSTWQLLALPF